MLIVAAKQCLRCFFGQPSSVLIGSRHSIAAGKESRSCLLLCRFCCSVCLRTTVPVPVSKLHAQMGSEVWRLELNASACASACATAACATALWQRRVRELRYASLLPLLLRIPGLDTSSSWSRDSSACAAWKCFRLQAPFRAASKQGLGCLPQHALRLKAASLHGAQSKSVLLYAHDTHFCRQPHRQPLGRPSPLLIQTNSLYQQVAGYSFITDTRARLHWTLRILSLALPHGDFHLQAHGEGTGSVNRALEQNPVDICWKGLQLLHLPFQDCRAVLCCMDLSLSLTFFLRASGGGSPPLAVANPVWCETNGGGKLEERSQLLLIHAVAVRYLCNMWNRVPVPFLPSLIRVATARLATHPTCLRSKCLNISILSIRLISGSLFFLPPGHGGE